MTAKKLFLRIGLVSLSIGLNISGVCAGGTPNLLVPITFHGSNGATQILYLGINPHATNGMDTLFGERELPPPPPGGGFDIRAVGDGLGVGSKVDFRQYFSSNQTDTFRVQLYTESYPISVSWPTLGPLFTGAVSMHTLDSTIDMKSTDSYVITDPDVQFFRIFCQGPALSNSSDVILPLPDIDSYQNQTVTVNPIIFPASNTNAVWMDWGTTRSYDHSSPVQTIDSAAGLYHLYVNLQSIPGVMKFYFRLAFQHGDLVSFAPDDSTNNPFGYTPTINAFWLSTITNTSATISIIGSSYPPDPLSSTSAWIDWGTSTSYTSHADVPYSLATGYQYLVNGLLPGTIYHIRPSMKNNNGTTVGNDYVFYTGLPSATTLNADSITMTTALFHGVCSPNGRRTLAYFSYNQYYTTLNSDTIFFPGDSVEHSITARVTGLRPNTQYNVSLIARYDGLNFNVVMAAPIYVTTHQNPDAAGLVSSFHVRNMYGNGTLLHFGVYTDATNCVDAGLGESEYPPIFAAGPVCDSRLVGASTATMCLGEGVKFDLRPYISPAQIDTYAVRFGVDVGAYPVTLEWPPLDSAYSGPVTLVTPVGDIDMKANHSFTVTAPDYNQAEIIAQGPNCVPGFPIVITDSASRTDGSNIELTARVNANELPTSVWFEWGDSVSYAHTTDALDGGSGRTFVQVQTMLSGIGNQGVIRYRAVAQNLKSRRYGDDQYLVLSGVSGVTPEKPLPSETQLYQNYPNPFNPTTVLQYDLATRAHVRLVLYTVLGEKVRVLVDQEESPGTKQVVLDGSSLPSGIYFCRLTAGKVLEMRKLLLIK